MSHRPLPRPASLLRAFSAMLLLFVAACGTPPERDDAAEAVVLARGGDGSGAGSVSSYRRFIVYEDADQRLMLLDSRSGRTWYRRVGPPSTWMPMHVVPADTAAANFSPLKGLRQRKRTLTRRTGGSNVILLRFEIERVKDAFPLLLDRRSGKTWLRQVRPGGDLWWVPLPLVPADTLGNFAPLQAIEEEDEDQ